MSFFTTEKRETGLYTMYIKRKGEVVLRKGEAVYEMVEETDAFGETSLTVKKDALGQPIPKRVKVDILNVVKNYPQDIQIEWADKEQYTFFRAYNKDEAFDWVAKNDDKEIIATLSTIKELGNVLLVGVLNGTEIMFKVEDDSAMTQGFERVATDGASAPF